MVIYSLWLFFTTEAQRKDDHLLALRFLLNHREETEKSLTGRKRATKVTQIALGLYRSPRYTPPARNKGSVQKGPSHISGPSRLPCPLRYRLPFSPDRLAMLHSSPPRTDSPSVLSHPHSKSCRSTRKSYLRGLLLLTLIVLSTTGCVRRRLTVRSNPAGAMVYVDNQSIGTTPCSVDFTYYGTREIRLVKSGFETLTVNQPIPTPWYQVPPLDFVSDNLAMQYIRDNRTVSFNLQPQLITPVDEVIRRGEELRSRSLTGPVVPASTNVVSPYPPAGAPVMNPPVTGSPFLSPGPLRSSP